MVKDTSIPAGYKQTDVGVIPSDWYVKTVGEFTSATAGGTPSTLVPEYWNGNIRWMSSGELNLKKIYEVEGRITESGLKNSSTKIVPQKCVLIGLAGQGKTRGTAAINYVELSTNQSIAAIFPNDSFIPEYLFYNIDSRYYELRNLSTGDSGRGGLNLRIIKGIPVPLPTKEEQQAIVSALSDMDDLITSLEQLITKKRNIKQGAMQQLLTGKKRLPGFSGKWEVKKLEKTAEIIDPHPSHRAPKANSNGIPFVGIGDISINGTINYEKCRLVDEIIFEEHSQRYNLKDGLIGIGRVASIGKVVKFKDNIGKYTISPTLAVIKPKNINSDFLFYILNSKYAEEQFSKIKNGSTRNSVGMIVLREIQIPHPSTIQEQHAIAHILSDMDAEIESLEQEQNKYKALKQGMMQELLTGKTRLV